MSDADDDDNDETFDILYCFCIKQNHASFSSIHHIIITSHTTLRLWERFLLYYTRHGTSTCRKIVRKICFVLKKVKKTYRKPNNARQNGMGICGNTIMFCLELTIFSISVNWKYCQPSNERRQRWLKGKIWTHWNRWCWFPVNETTQTHIQTKMYTKWNLLLTKHRHCTRKNGFQPHPWYEAVNKSIAAREKMKRKKTGNGLSIERPKEMDSSRIHLK